MGGDILASVCDRALLPKPYSYALLPVQALKGIPEQTGCRHQKREIKSWACFLGKLFKGLDISVKTRANIAESAEGQVPLPRGGLHNLWLLMERMPSTGLLAALMPPPGTATKFGSSVPTSFPTHLLKVHDPSESLA